MMHKSRSTSDSNSTTAPVSVIKIKAIGLGGGGQNTINRMLAAGIEGHIEYITANTDAQALRQCQAPRRILLGKPGTRGLGAGGDPEVGKAAALESRDELRAALSGADLIFLTAGMGGGTGSGSIPVAAEIARESGAITVAVVTTPFMFEGTKRERNALAGIEKLKMVCDTVIVVPNDRLLEVLPRDIKLDMAFRVADNVLHQGLQSIVEIISNSGLINVDFAHIRCLLQLPGQAMMTIGFSKGENCIMGAMRNALDNPLLDLNAIEHAGGVLMYFIGGEDLSLHAMTQATECLQRITGTDTQVVWGTSIDPLLNGRAQVILIVTGIRPPAMPEHAPEPPVAQAARPTPAVETEASGASALFEQAVQKPAHVLSELPPQPLPGRLLDPGDLDIPTFLRRRTFENARRDT